MAELEAERAGQPKISVSSADADTPENREKHRRFLQEVADRGKRMKEETERRTEELLAENGREALFGKLIERLWLEATWLKSTSHFADGKPLDQQFKWNLIIIGKLLGGLAAWEQKQLEGKQQVPEEFEYMQRGGPPHGIG